ncbi:hypothetical protein [Raoultella ornithinolytica]|uniref:hypothetical protein n=1 Tax=Raoultella ornithinolytica TaxID=54291 RepID=UPI000FEB8946|nr:hypothetical protein [Raoultella ornithinolytica]QQQ04631.1 hypothetical protein JJL43_15540 [Raoultella ornithinolytica]HCH7896130.1 hypothetical protein [Raoultella ornithinolytica]HDH7844750.1 hypothetical protein [Raoultella ornithinolytica]HDV8371358.1 hypothetical protein [Raoultella ornithinolytica]HEQ3501078.1 hypothetical protein [Raoultella ornithinolytica]
MKIMIVRHGKPDIDVSKKVFLAEMHTWMQNYNESEVSENCPRHLSYNIPVNGLFVFSSPAPRALTSLKMMGLKPDVIDPVFHEAQLAVLNFPYCKLPPLKYLFLLRILWFMGYAKNIESCPSAWRRAASAASMLTTCAENNSPVLLMGHGIINKMIGSQLKHAGFRKVDVIDKSYWQTDVYEKD